MAKTGPKVDDVGLTVAAFNPMSDAQVATTTPAPPVEAIDFNPMADELVEDKPPTRPVLTYAEAYRQGGEFVLVIGPETTARTMTEVVTCPVARAEQLGNKPAGIYRVFDGPAGKQIAAWESSVPQSAKQTPTGQWQRVCTPAGCQWIRVE